MLHHAFTDAQQFRLGFDGVQNDRNLSDFGRAAKIKKMDELKQAHQAAVLAATKSEIGGYKKRYQELVSREQAANRKAADSWNYERLNYYSNLVKATIERSKAVNPLSKKTPLDSVAAEYNKAIDSGDRELARSWAEIGPSAIRAVFGEDKRAAGIVRQMESDLSNILDTSELVKIRMEGKTLADNILELKAGVENLIPFFGTGGFAIEPLRQVLADSGLTISKSYNPESFEHFETTSVSFADVDANLTAGEGASVGAAAG